MATITRHSYSKWHYPGEKTKTGIFEICLFRMQTLPSEKVRTISVVDGNKHYAQYCKVSVLLS